MSTSRARSPGSLRPAAWWPTPDRPRSSRWPSTRRTWPGSPTSGRSCSRAGRATCATTRWSIRAASRPCSGSSTPSRTSHPVSGSTSTSRCRPRRSSRARGRAGRRGRIARETGTFRVLEDRQGNRACLCWSAGRSDGH
ncbi:hypothetical protein G7085_09970 [Tessaracoccus sp. HDW20]|nr:hypothetical protein [Tessaracoccus coleopterorum]NHB84816.1 hypothetical protein [Tessaracoccus coleopterorum]